MESTYLGTFEEIVLLAVCVRGNDADGVTVTDEINGQAGRPVHLSAVHTALYRLEEKGLLRSGLGGATTSRGGRRKRLYGAGTVLQHPRSRRNPGRPPGLPGGWFCIKPHLRV